ncbi:uncharacterized protein UTRI_01640_B [Ustilago trichophora]|uniref:DEK-C domain-containing protein n=1 Tax=Ustilago trichophora TaxID=86804 RepID=A0A5C3E1U3_9BASI|nr:uncharacterized protein UTRI_01640_B [Ustilago trichophora]
MSLPSDSELVKQVYAIIVKAYETDTVAEHSKRKVREMLSEHFGVDLESKKKVISQMTMDQLNLVSASRDLEKMQAQSSTSRSPSPAKSAKPAKAKASKAKAVKNKTPTKRKAASPSDLDEEDQSDGGADYAGASADPTSDPSEIEAEADDFSELEEDSSISRSRKQTKSTQSAKTKSSPSASKTKKASASRSSTGGSEAEQRLTRLKKLVAECGVRKPWKKLYEAEGISETDFSGQCRVVQGVLTELGMTGKGSVEQARKIREQREFADELAALQENKVIDGGGRARRTRGSIGSASSTKRSGGKTITISDDSEDSDEESDFEEEAKAKRPNKKAKTSNATSRSKKVSDSDDSEDEGPTRRSFKSSLASFAADLNSDSD